MDVTVGGKRRTKTAATLEAALLAREALRNAASAASNSAGTGDDAGREDWTLAQATERTMQVVWAGKSAYKTMRINSRAVLGFFGADTPVRDITLDRIDRFVAHLLNERGNSGGTVNRKLSCLSRILRRPPSALRGPCPAVFRESCRWFGACPCRKLGGG